MRLPAGITRQPRHPVEARPKELFDQSFETWSALIETGLSRIRETGGIKRDANTKAIAIAVLAAIRGGLLLSKTARKVEPLKLAFDNGA